MANDFKAGDWVTWKFGNGSPDQIVSFGWQHQTAFLSRQAKSRRWLPRRLGKKGHLAR